MRRAVFIQYLLAHGAVAGPRGRSSEVYVTAAGRALVPLDAEIDDFIVASTCKALDIPLPPGMSARPKRPVIRKERIVLEVPPGAEVLIKPKKPRGAGPGRKRKSRG